MYIFSQQKGIDHYVGEYGEGRQQLLLERTNIRPGTAKCRPKPVWGPKGAHVLKEMAKECCAHIPPQAPYHGRKYVRQPIIELKSYRPRSRVDNAHNFPYHKIS